MASATVEVNSASLGGWTTTENGIDVLPGETVSVRLIDSAGVRLWRLSTWDTDDLLVAPTYTQASSVSGVATFVAPSSPSSGWTLLIKSSVGYYDYDFDRESKPRTDYSATFGVYRRTAQGYRTVAVNERQEASAEFGWAATLNKLLRAAASGGTGVPSGRTLIGTTPIRIDGGASGDLSSDRTISLVPGTVAGQVLGWDGASWLARQVVVLTGVTISTLGLGVVHSSAGGVLSSSLVVNADVSASAAIAVSKLAPGADGQALVTTAGVATWGTVTAGAVTPGTARQIYFTNTAGSAAAWLTAAGDISVPTTAGTFRVDKINGTAVTTAGGALTTGGVLRVTAGAVSDWGQLDLANANAVTGLLAVTHIAPSVTNGQVLSTVGGVSTWSAISNTSISPGAANTVLTTNAGATATAWALVVNANIDAAAAIAVTKIAPGGLNYTLITDGTGTVVWSAGVPGTGTLAGDATGPIGSNVVERIHGATVPIAGGLTTGNGLYVSGAAALSYSALNLGGGAGWVTGALPLANIAQGGAILNDVLRWNGSVWDPEPIGNILPPSATQSQNVATIAAMQLLAVTAFPDGTSCWVRTVDREYRLKTTAQTASADNDTYGSATAGRLWMGAA